MENCWEYKQCGREPGGVHTSEKGVCSAAVERRCEGVNRGTAAGRVCWLVAGTLCDGEVQGMFAHKIPSCMLCDFYQRVHREEGAAFEDGSRILPQLCEPDEVAKAYAQLQRAYLQLRETQDHLLHAQKLEAVGKLAAGVAHEINTPLIAILTYSEELLEDLPEGDTSRADLDVIHREALRCRQIVRDLLDFSRRNSPERQRIPIAPVIRRTLAMVQRQHSFRNIRFHLELDDRGTLLQIDPNQMQQVLLNLVINARDAMDGEGTIIVRTEMVGEGKRFRLEIRDHGCGVPSEIRARIFDPFFSTKGEHGNGLGLAAVHSIIEEHGGKITVESEPEQGTSFFLTLPRSVS